MCNAVEVQERALHHTEASRPLLVFFRPDIHHPSSLRLALLQQHPPVAVCRREASPVPDSRLTHTKTHRCLQHANKFIML